MFGSIIQNYLTCVNPPIQIVYNGTNWILQKGFWNREGSFYRGIKFDEVVICENIEEFIKQVEIYIREMS